MYNIHEHRHRVAVWGAGRAYSRQGPGHTVAVARQLIEGADLHLINTADDLPSANEIDAFIDERIERVIERSRSIQYLNKDKVMTDLVCTYGRAQKLVNMYLKLKVVCAGSGADERVRQLHPPLDKVLLDALDVSQAVDRPEDLQDFKAALKAATKLGKAWTKFDRATYNAYIKAIRIFQGNQPLWAAERLWSPERTAVED